MIKNICRTVFQTVFQAVSQRKYKIIPLKRAMLEKCILLFTMFRIKPRRLNDIDQIYIFELRSNLKLIIDPSTFLVSSIHSLKGSISVFFSSRELPFKQIAIIISIFTLSVEVILCKFSLISIFICKFKDADSVFHATTPISLVFSS